ncbi:hypothetical protein DFH08DRAFT_722237, partial [Mycena albidolilacea]
FCDALGQSLAKQLHTGLDWLEGVVWDVGQHMEVSSDAGLGRVTALTAAVWSEVGRLTRERQTGKFAMGAEPQILSGEKHGRRSRKSRGRSERRGTSQAAKEGARDSSRGSDYKTA